MSTEETTPEQTTPQADGGEPSLLHEILAETNKRPGEEAYEDAKRGLQAVVAQIVSHKDKADVSTIDKALVDMFIAEIDVKLSAQINEILHHPMFQRLESAWRGLKFLVDRVDFRENTKVELLNCSKEDLLHDFEDTPEIPKSGMYKTV